MRQNFVIYFSIDLTRIDKLANKYCYTDQGLYFLNGQSLWKSSEEKTEWFQEILEDWKKTKLTSKLNE